MGMHNPALGHRHGLSDLLSSLPALCDSLHLLRLLLQLEQLWLVLALGGSEMPTTITLLQKKKKKKAYKCGKSLSGIQLRIASYTCENLFGRCISLVL